MLRQLGRLVPTVSRSNVLRLQPTVPTMVCRQMSTGKDPKRPTTQQILDSPRTMKNLRKMTRKYKKPYVVKQNIVLTSTLHDLINEVAKGDTAASLLYIGRLFANGSPVIDRDYGRALKFFESAADQGNAYACFCVGRIYYYGHGVDIDYDKAHTRYLDAYRRLYDREGYLPDGAEEVAYKVCYALGHTFKEGRGCLMNVKMGNELIEQAIALFIKVRGVPEEKK